MDSITIQPGFKIHEVKTDPEPFNEIEEGLKRATVRRDDRGYSEGDYIVLRKTKYTGEQMADEFNQHPLVYTGRSLMCKITHIHNEPGMVKGWAVLSIDILDRFPGKV